MSEYVDTRPPVFYRYLAVLVGLWLGCQSVPAMAQQVTDRSHTLVIGKVSDNPRKHYGQLKPMVDYAVAHMADLGITQGRVLMARDNRQMIEYLRDGRVDWVTETVFSAQIYAQQAGAELVLKKWKKGAPSYHSVIFVRKDAGIATLADLEGHSIAFEDPGSTSAYFLPASVLKGQGLTLTRLDSPRQPVPAGTVGFAFSGEEVNTATWVYKGLVQAGAFSNMDWDKYAHLSEQAWSELKVIHRTRDYPRAVELVRAGLDPAVKMRLVAVLLNASNDPDAASVLKRYQKTTRFERFDKTDRDALKQAREMVSRF